MVPESQEQESTRRNTTIETTETPIIYIDSDDGHSRLTVPMQNLYPV